MKAAVAGVAAILAALLGVPIFLLIVLGGGASGVAAATVAAAVCRSIATPSASPSATPDGGLDSAQTDAANQIVAAAATRGLGEQGAAIALDVALARTDLHASLTGIGSAVGVFAMTPGASTSADELADTYASANVFFDLLDKVAGWQSLPPAAAATAALPELKAGSYAAVWSQAQQVAATLFDTTSEPTSRGQSLPRSPCDITSSGLTTADVERILSFASAQVGDAYVLGANGPDAWDCSSLVRAAFAQVGIRLPRVANGRWTARSPWPSRKRRGPAVAFPCHRRSSKRCDTGDSVRMPSAKRRARYGKTRMDWFSPQLSALQSTLATTCEPFGPLLNAQGYGASGSTIFATRPRPSCWRRGFRRAWSWRYSVTRRSA